VYFSLPCHGAAGLFTSEYSSASFRVKEAESVHKDVTNARNPGPSRSATSSRPTQNPEERFK
ncbi:MAG: hypothetical protein VW446_00725, partial [Alphaproteobacteria bacterium]